MSFSFNFFAESERGSDTHTSTAADPPRAAAAVAAEARYVALSLADVAALPLPPVPSPAAAAALPSATPPMPELQRYTLLAAPGFSLWKVAVDDVDELTSARGRDVVPGSYEGGAKTWECTDDLIALLLREADVLASAGAAGGLASAATGGAGTASEVPELHAAPPRATVHGACVLDMGCGSGLAGLTALACGARAVWFQDLNEPVLRHITAPNVACNFGHSPVATGQRLAGSAGAGACLDGSTDASQACHFVAASWAGLAQRLARGSRGCGAAHEAEDAAALAPLAHGVDVVLSSETVYNPSYYPQLLDLLDAVLKPGGSSVALLSNKRYYFGAELGGGTTQFRAAVEADGRFNAVLYASHEDGRSMTRDILCLTRRVA